MNLNELYLKFIRLHSSAQTRIITQLDLLADQDKVLSRENQLLQAFGRAKAKNILTELNNLINKVKE